MAASLNELLADKVNALAQRNFLRGRDLFDIWFLVEAKKAALRDSLILRKFADYGTDAPFETLAARRNEPLREALEQEMGRFLPLRQRHLMSQSGYVEVVETVRRTVDEVLAWL